MPAPPPRPPPKPPPNIMPNRPAPSMPPIRPERNGLRAMKPPDCGAAGAAVAGCLRLLLPASCFVPRVSRSARSGSAAGAWSVWLPRLPELEPAPARASANEGATTITAAITASQRIFFTIEHPCRTQPTPVMLGA